MRKGINGKQKGSRGEREVAGIVQQWWQRFETTAEFVKTPMSGGWRKDTNVRAHFAACGDIMTTGSAFPFCVEVKWREGWSVDFLLDSKQTPPWEWWRQCLEAARDQDDAVPMMWLRRNRVKGTRAAFPWMVWVPAAYADQKRLSEPDVRWSAAQLEANGVDCGGVLPVAYVFTRFIKMDPQRMRAPRTPK